MIGRVYRGGKVGGLLRYLYGPGRHNEHENPNLVAAWDLDTAAELATLEPRVLAGEGARAVRDFGPITANLELATALRRVPESVAARQVWRCPLRVAPGDRTLSDAEWAEVARDVMSRTGIAPRGDDGGCRWVAVRHDEHSVHLVAVLARQDGRPVRLSHDQVKFRQACRDAETRFGLTGTAPADRTAATHTTRAEVEKTGRTRGPDVQPDRDWLREQVQLAAVLTHSPTEFLHLLRAGGVLVQERHDPEGTLTGYAVARPSSGSAKGQEPVFFGGGKLAPDLSLRKLQARWHDHARIAPLTVTGRGLQTPAQRAAAVAHSAALSLRDTRQAGFEREQAVLPTAAADVLTAAVRVLDGEPAKALARVVRQFDRACREPGGRPAPATARSRGLRDAAFGLMQAGRVSASDGVLLLGQLLLLVDNIRQLRKAQGRVAQARAAERATQGLRRAAHEQLRRQVLEVTSRATRTARTSPSHIRASSPASRRR